MAIEFTGVTDSIGNAANKETAKEKRKAALNRAAILKEAIKDYLAAREAIPTGFDVRNSFERAKETILRFFGATEENWNDWQWQLRHRITHLETLAHFVALTDQDREEIAAVSGHLRWAISP